MKSMYQDSMIDGKVAVTPTLCNMYTAPLSSYHHNCNLLQKKKKKLKYRRGAPGLMLCFTWPPLLALLWSLWNYTFSLITTPMSLNQSVQNTHHHLCNGPFLKNQPTLECKIINRPFSSFPSVLSHALPFIGDRDSVSNRLLSKDRW